MGISTFIILKNEAETILSTLQCASLFSEEIIIGIDDATSDRSLDAIGGWLPVFGGEVEIFEFRWNDDFSEARNRAISKCTQDWIFQLDAHEHLRPVSNPVCPVLKVLHLPFHEACGYLLRYAGCAEKPSVKTLFSIIANRKVAGVRTKKLSQNGHALS